MVFGILVLSLLDVSGVSAPTLDSEIPLKALSLNSFERGNFLASLAVGDLNSNINSSQIEKSIKSDNEIEDEIIERDGTKYIVRDGEEYLLSTPLSTYYLEFTSLPSSICNNEKYDVKVKGNLQLSLSQEEASKCFADLLFYPYRHNVGFDLYLYESDAVGDDRIAELFTSAYTYNCVSVYFSEKVFEDANLGYYVVDDPGDYGEVYAKATSNVVATSTPTVDILGYSNCDCLSGACCNLASRPYKFKLSGSQPTDYTDEYYCSGANSPTGTNYVVKRDYYCNGIDASFHYSDSNYDTCGTCEYCTSGDSSCNFYSSSTSCGTKDCDYLDTSCRDYNDVNRYCSSGSCGSGTCNDYTNQPEGTSCGTGKECDGSGNCITCESSSYLWCHDHGYASQDCNKYLECYSSDSYWYDDCSNMRDKAKECGESSCDFWNKYCNGNDLRQWRWCYDKGCSNKRCYANAQKEDELIETCQYGCLDDYMKCRDPNVKCYFDSDCPIDGWANLKCQDNDVWGMLTDYFCVSPGTLNSYCDFTGESKKYQECGDDSYSLNYCYDNDVYKDFTDRGCSTAYAPPACFENTIKQKVQECGLVGCSGGKCNIACFQNSDCGADGWVGSTSCSNDDIFQNYRTYICNNPGTVDASCSYTDSLQLKQDCGNDECELWQDNYCYDNDVYHSRTCHDKGCSLGNCFDNIYEDKQKVLECGDAGCENGNCKFNVNFYSPVNGNWYKTKSILLNVSLSEKVKYLYYKINTGIWNILCTNCNKYTGTKYFAEGQDNLAIWAVTYTNQNYYPSITFNIDSIKPTINAIYPSYYGNGNFGVKYTEANLKDVTLYYDLTSSLGKTKQFINCNSGSYVWCYDFVDLSAYNGQYIYYKFSVKDNLFSTNSSTKKILIDISNPIMNVFNPKNNAVYTNSYGNVYVNISVNEKSKLQYKDNNLNWVTLCSSCTYYKNNRKFTFGEHNVIFKATDLAGNYDERLISFVLKQY